MPFRSYINRLGCYLLLMSSLLLAGTVRADVGNGQMLLGIPTVDAAKFNVEFQRFGDRLQPLYRQYGVQPFLIEANPLYGAQSETNAAEEEILRELRQCQVVDLTTSNEGRREEDMAHATAAGAALRRFVEEGGGLLIRPQAQRYPSDEDERYWSLVFEPLGVKILHEGVYDKTRTLKNSFGRNYFYTKAIKAHPVTEHVDCLYLPMTGFNPFAGIPLLQYSADWQVIVSGEAEAKSYRSGAPDNPNRLNLASEGSCPSAPPVVAVRTLGKGRIVCWPLTALDGGMNYGNPLWPGTVEENGDPAANRASQGMRLIFNAYRWLAEPAQGVASLGTYQAIPYKPAEFPASLDSAVSSSIGRGAASPTSAIRTARQSPLRCRPPV